jgi:hypothetical protein
MRPSSEPQTDTQGVPKRALFDSHVNAPGDTGQCKILFLSANPRGLGQVGADIRLPQEVRDIRRFLAQGNRDLTLVSEWAVSVEEVIRANLQHRAMIVHFSGHGAPNGIYMEDASGAATLVSGEALRMLFAPLRHVKLVVLNGCSTSEQARAVAAVVPLVVGTDDAVSDSAARAFSEAFYGALGYGKSVGDAFVFGKACVEGKARGYSQYFRLHLQEGARDPDTVHFIVR